MMFGPILPIPCDSMFEKHRLSAVLRWQGVLLVFFLRAWESTRVGATNGKRTCRADSCGGQEGFQGEASNMSQAIRPSRQDTENNCLGVFHSVCKGMSCSAALCPSICCCQHAHTHTHIPQLKRSRQCDQVVECQSTTSVADSREGSLFKLGRAHMKDNKLCCRG